MKPFDVYPIFDIEPVRAQGSWLWDSKGQKYLDFYGGHAVISIGHSHPHYIKRISDQLNNIAFYSNSVKIPIQDQLAEKLGQLSGYPDYQFFMCNSGAEANENALKLASFLTGRKKIIAFSGGFHGRTSAAVAATDNPSIVAPVNAGHDIEILPFNDEQALEEAINEEVAAVIIEGIQGVAGIYTPSESFLKKIESLCKRKGAMLILDEVQSGYGRSGKFFAHQFSGVKPDLITVAKGMGNGFPVAGVLISPVIKPKHGMLGTTFGGNFLACAAALAVLEVMEEEDLIANTVKMGEYLINHMEGLSGIKEIRGKGLMLGIELEQNSAELRTSVLKDYHVFTGSASNKNTLRLLPSLNITREECDVFLEAFKKALQKSY
jgi:acetylornithine/N-succinyldiaminopimelate aminotransferase